ncbi:lipopolysaccharide transport system permease protein [Desulfobotulus alkaliphilus]|uniref:Transport permease protein n=1 Tax=Desulfobotulus alkaliphilus TaxID=622671 RepID=A0A562RAJ2_9BACT|nr:ABC transporter permease [Desulfobotulus alkaliphilus]TWI66078.1 lipopolysaccharide transport system permease protein [Desulfobotulus alkaliphilus]
MLTFFYSIWAYRGFIFSSIRNEFVARFARSKLGGLWMVINPLAQVGIYAIILSNVLAAKLPGIDNPYAYALYLTAGITAWSLFTEIIGRCLTLFIDNGNLMKKIRFPRITMPVIVAGSCLLNYTLLLAAVLVVFALLGHVPGPEVLWLIPLTMVNASLALGAGLILGTFNVFVRDVGQITPIILQALFWFTPIVYPIEIVPDTLQGILAYNPMLPIVSAYHNVLVYGTPPPIQSIVITMGVAVTLLLLSLFMFRRAAPEMVDAL